MLTVNGDRFQSYANDAHDRVMNEVADEGTSAEMIDWLREEPGRNLALVEILDLFAHRSILARGDYARGEALDQMLKSLGPWADRFVASWDDGRRTEFMDEIDEEARVARALDLEEGIDD